MTSVATGGAITGDIGPQNVTFSDVINTQV